MATVTDPRRRMVRRQIAGRGIADRRVLAAMEKVPREAFLPEAMQEFAYEDTPLPIEEGQTMSQPYIVARMAEAADVSPVDRVLEIGAGSGYAAAVLGELAGRVFTIERHPALADLARARLRQLGYDNVEVRTGDGTLGWPEQAPFDAIIATAGGPRVPDTWRAQLAVDGRLVMPVGATPTHQRLIRLTRTGPETWHEEEIEEVRFVPLIGEQGWSEEHETFRDKPRREPRPTSGLHQLIRAAEQPLPALEDASFASAFDRYADRRVVLLGEASHGTSEFYRARAAITRRLIERHGFSFVAVEADWPDALTIDRYVRHLPARPGGAPGFSPLPHLDVAQHRRRSLRRMAARPQRAAAGRTPRRLLRPRHLQPGRFDRRRARLSRHGRSRGGQGRPRALRLPHAVAARSRGLWPRRAERALSRLRGRHGGRLARSSGQAAGLCRP